MLRTRFWPMTASPIRPMSQFGVGIIVTKAKCYCTGPCKSGYADTPPERIAVVHNQRSFRIHKSRSADARKNVAAPNLDRAFEDASDEAFLPPEIAGLELAIGVQTCEFRAGARAARRAVIGKAGTEHEIARVVRRVARRTYQLNVIDLGVACLPEG